ncbi:MAG: hypothetical protein M3457_06015 [Chloroflexota bacterium]|nr:hypothetical protein [Chloroflexota bacterium]
MNRRSLLTVVSTLFGTQSPPVSAVSAAGRPLDHLAGRAFAGDAQAGSSVGYLTVIVRNASSVLAAERTRLALLAQAGDIERGLDIHATHVNGRSLPDRLAQLPGSLVTWDTVAGAAAVRTRWAAGYFRRGDLVWEIIATGAKMDDLARLVIDLADDLTSRQITGPDPSAPQWTGGLWSLLPNGDDLPSPMRLDTVFAGDQVYDVGEAAIAA